MQNFLIFLNQLDSKLGVLSGLVYGLNSPFWIMNVKRLFAREAFILKPELQSVTSGVCARGVTDDIIV